MDRMSIDELIKVSAGLPAEVMEKLADNAGIGFFNIDLVSGEIKLNRNITSLTGYEPGDLPHSADTKTMLTFEEDRPRVRQAVEGVLSGREPVYQIEYRMRRRDGSIVAIYETAMVYSWDEEGNPAGLAGMSQDLSRLKWAEEKALTMQMENRRLAQGASESALAEQNRLLRAANAAAAMIIGGFHQDYETVLRQALQILGESIGADRAHIWRNTEKDGKMHFFLRSEWARTSGSFTNPMGTLLSYDDYIPGWRQTITPDFFIILRKEDMSEAMADFPGMQDVLSLMLVPLFLHGEFWGFIGFDDCTSGRLFTEDEAEIMGAGARVIASSISRNETFSKLNEARQAAMESTRAKGEFLSRMSHEIRTPLNAIIGMAAIARRTDDPERIQNSLDKIDNASRQLLDIVNDVLDMSKIESGKLEISHAPFDFEGLLAHVAGVVQTRTEEKHQSFRVDGDGPYPCLMVSDELRLSQVLINLLGNAVKFTPEGGAITLKVRRTPLEGGRARLRVEVRDTGIGVSKESQRHLFQSFEQADGGITRQFGGTGLGLSISKRIVELMGGEIWVESEEGQGSNFIFEVGVGWGGPREAAMPEQEEDADAPHTFAGKTILLAEDVEINREIVHALLEDTGATVLDAEDGVKAVEAFTKADGGIDLILMDVQMPHMDGLAATRRIRKLDMPSAKTVPIVAMSANAFKEDEQHSLEAGMNAHLSKPLDTDLFFRALESYLKC